MGKAKFAIPSRGVVIRAFAIRRTEAFDVRAATAGDERLAAPHTMGFRLTTNH